MHCESTAKKLRITTVRKKTIPTEIVQNDCHKIGKGFSTKNIVILQYIFMTAIREDLRNKFTIFCNRFKSGKTENVELEVALKVFLMKCEIAKQFAFLWDTIRLKSHEIMSHEI